MRRLLSTLGAVGPALVAGCSPADGGGLPAALETAGPGAGPPWFDEVAVERGIDHVWHSGHAEKFYMPEIVGGGAALFDKDDDGDLDAYLVDAGEIEASPEERPPNRLFANRGDGYFDDVTEASGAGDRGYGMGVACGDYDGDGRTDVYVTNYGKNVLLRNRDGNAFDDVSRETRTAHPGWGTSAAFFDADRDGDLDLFVANYLNWSLETDTPCYNDRSVFDYCGPNSFDAPAMDTFLRNEGDGTYTDRTVASGLDAIFGNGLGVAVSDFNGDGWLDVFVANDGRPDQLWANQRGSGFTDVGPVLGCALDDNGTAKAGMGVTVEDVDDDGDPDLLVCNLRGESDSFYLNQGSYFEDYTARSGLGHVNRRFTRFGQGFADFDNDGTLDLYQANGKVAVHEVGSPSDPYAEPNLLYRGLAGVRFEEVAPRGGTAQELLATSRAAAFGDVDGDGRLDVLVANKDSRAYLLHNVVAEKGHWIRFAVKDARGHDALNAVLRVRFGGRDLRREVRPSSSYLASHDPRVHVGLGPSPRVERVTVTWLDGTQESFGGFEADQVVELRAGSGTSVSADGR